MMEGYDEEYQRYSEHQKRHAASHEKGVIAHSTNHAAATAHSDSTNPNVSVSKSRRRLSKVPSLRFEDVQQALTSSDIERIFRQYAGSIRGGVSNIKRSGSEISMGSLSMHLSKGAWIRHSTGAGGNIFSFVQAGAQVSKRQSLEIVAELAGIRAESSSYDYQTHVATGRASKEQGVGQDKLQAANEWFVAQDKITNTESFDPNKHLKGMLQHNTLEAVYSYTKMLTISYSAM